MLDANLKKNILLEIRLEKSLAAAVVKTVKSICHDLSLTENAYLQARQLDIQDVGLQILQAAYGGERFSSAFYLGEDSVCIAKDLTPSQFLALDKDKLKGLILSQGTKTSHTVILARSFDVPTLVGVERETLQESLGTRVVIDTDSGVVVQALTAPIQAFYERELEIKEITKARQMKFIYKKGRTKDGLSVEIGANIASEAEVARAFSAGAEGIGLFRTELLYMNRPTAPSEESMLGVYRQVAEVAQGRRVIVRTIDIGGDKPIDYFQIPKEENPFLGYRAVRIYDEFIDIFKSQLRAILKASAFGRLNIMVPMVSSIEEVRFVRGVLDSIKDELREEGTPFDDRIPLGIMLEIPSVLFAIDSFCEEVDFFSIGTNDLTQYLMAVDRGNPKVAHLYDSFHPALIRALHYGIKTARENGSWIGLCGELGGDSRALPLFVGMGINEISMASASIASTKESLAKLDSNHCKALLDEVLTCKTTEEIKKTIDTFSQSESTLPLLDEGCVMLDVQATSKEAIIKAMIDNLFIKERTTQRQALEDDIWAREAVFSTGLGFDFAIPHTKSEHIAHSTISVARLAEPVVWGEEHAQLVIMLTLNARSSDLHMKVFSKLSRKIMDETFRRTLLEAKSEKQVIAFLTRELELASLGLL